MIGEVLEGCALLYRHFHQIEVVRTQVFVYSVWGQCVGVVYFKPLQTSQKLVVGINLSVGGIDIEVVDPLCKVLADAVYLLLFLVVGHFVSLDRDAYRAWLIFKRG